MNMTKKRSPRKKRFEYCRHLCFETWFITFTITIFILLSSRCGAAVSVLNITDSDIPSETSSREDTNGNYSSNYTNLIENTSFGYARVDERSGNDTLVNGSNPVTFPATVSTVYAIEHKKAPNEGIPLVIKATRVNNNDIIIFNKTKTIAKPSVNFKNKTDGAAAYKKSNGSQPHKYKSSTRVPKLKNSHHGVNNNEVNSDEYYLSDFDRNVKGDKVYFGDVKNHDYRNMNGKNKSVTKNKSVKNKTSGSKNRTHASVTGIIVKSEDEVEEYETKLADDKDEYDRTTKKTITPEEEADTGALGVLQKLAEGVLESLAERLLPAGLRDIFRRVQDQNIALETLRLRSREENGGLGIFGRSLLKGLADPLNSWMQGGSKDNGSLDSDRGFLNGVLSGVADSVGDAFKIRVTAIYPGTLWCGDGHLAHTQSAEVGLFFKTDSCCRLHDSCRLYILAGQSDYGLTNTGLFTRSHCSCDSAFYRCLRRTNSLVSSQIGATYFSILGPQCFKREHPIVKCMRRTRITGQKCEEYELDKSQPKIWQWFDSPTF